MATFEDVRRLGLPLPEVTEGTFYGTAALKVRGKRFAGCGANVHTLLNCHPVPFAAIE